MKLLPTLFTGALVLLPVTAMSAETVTATMHVTLEVVKSCTLKANDLSFSRHSSDEAGEIQASTQLNVTCTNGTPFTLSAYSSDNSDSGTFWLKPENNGSGAQSIAWKLYADENKQTQVTNSQGLTGTGNGQEQSETLYGVIEAGALAAAQAGTYTDDVTLNLVY
ncbi:spore coat protein U domain-containing protein [Enterobacter wuhouensis]|uniref:Csu type fimbrial protein n=1 Tax=Enterobacter wuhouensis TaxID=2529381 RepID=UPI002FD0A2A4